MTNDQWVVTLHYQRGRVQTEMFTNKSHAQRLVNHIVFTNEDCINCSIYRQSQAVKYGVLSVPGKPDVQVQPLKEMDFADLDF